MGAVKVDFASKRKNNDVIYAYTSGDGVKTILQGYHRLRSIAERGTGDSSDVSTVVMDIENAVNTRGLLSPRQRQIVALLFNLDMSNVHTARLLGVTPQAAQDIMNTLCSRLSRKLSGEPYSVIAGGEAGISESCPPAVRDYLVNVAAGRETPLAGVNNGVIRELQAYLAQSDRLMSEGLEEKRNPTHRYVYLTKYADATTDPTAARHAEYPYYTGKLVKKSREMKHLSPETIMRLRRYRDHLTKETPLILTPSPTRFGKRSSAEVGGAHDSDDFDTKKRFMVGHEGKRDWTRRWRDTKKYRKGSRKHEA